MEVLIDTVLRFISDTRFENLPDKLIHQAKRCLLDTLGALLAGDPFQDVNKAKLPPNTEIISPAHTLDRAFRHALVM